MSSASKEIQVPNTPIFTPRFVVVLNHSGMENDGEKRKTEWMLDARREKEEEQRREKEMDGALGAGRPL